MQKKKLVWLFNNLNKYEYTDAGFAVKDEFSQLLVTEDTLENEEIREQAVKCYDKFVSCFYNDILGYQNGLADKGITSGSLDCYFVQTADGYIPIGLYKEQRPAETSAMVQMYLEQCKDNIKKDRNKAISKWQRDIFEISEKYKMIGKAKNPSLLKAIAGIFSSIPLLLWGIYNLFNSVIFGKGAFQSQNANALRKSSSLFRENDKTGIIFLGCFCAISVIIAVIALINSIKEILLFREKKNTINVLNEIHANVREMEKGTAEFQGNGSEECFNAARKGQDIFVDKNENAVLADRIKTKIEKALGYVRKTDKARSAIGAKTFILVLTAYVSAFVIMLVNVPGKNADSASDGKTVTDSSNAGQIEQRDKTAGTKAYAQQATSKKTENDPEIISAADIIKYTNVSYQTYNTIESPAFNTYIDNEFGFVIDYPAHFNVYASADNTVRKIYMSDDGSAVLKINAGYNKGGITCKQLNDELIDTYKGEVTYNPVKDTWFALSIDDNDNYHYAYYKLYSGEIRGFEFHFKGAENLPVYSRYIDHIYASFKNK